MSIPGTEDSLELPFLIDLFLKCNYTIEARNTTDEGRWD